MSNQDIINHGKAVDAFGAAQQDMLDKLADAQQKTLDAANAVAPRVAAIESTSTTGVIFYHPVRGDDANDGLTANTPVKTWTGLASKYIADRYMIVRLMADIVADRRIRKVSPPKRILFLGYDDQGLGLQRRKITFIDDVDNPAVPGGIAVDNDMTFEAFDVDLEMAYDAQGFALTPIRHSRFDMGLRNVVISRTGSGRALLGGIFSGHITRINAVIDPSAKGYFINGVPAGGDPKALSGLTANFNEA